MNIIHRLRQRGLSIPVFCVLVLSACQPAKNPSSRDQERATASLRTALGEIVLGSKAVFLPPGFLVLLPKGTSAKIPSADESAKAITNPSSFHTLNREYRFDRVFLPPGPVCAPLRDHLIGSSVWVLSQVSPEGYLFRVAGSTPWHAPDAAEAERWMPDPDTRSLWMILSAENLLAIGHNEEAASLLSMASCSKKHESNRLAALASLEASSGHWNKAVDLAGKSLRSETRNRTSTMILVRALTETGHRDVALEKARAFVRVSPDAESLFLLARAANAAGDHAEEISALRRLVATAKKENQAAGASLLYLGQALARDGQRGEALRILEEAQSAPELTAEQKQLIRELRDHLAPSS